VTEQTVEKSCKKLARRHDKAAALKVYGIFLVFLFCNIHTHILELEARNTSFGCKFSQLSYIIKYYLNRATFIDRGIKKVKGELF